MTKKHLTYLRLLLAIGFVSVNSCGKDDNCLQKTWYQDADSDGFGSAADTQQACVQPAGFVADNTDFDDDNAFSYPNAPELCNGIDDNGNGIVDEGDFGCGGGLLCENGSCVEPLPYYLDADGDGFGNASDSVLAGNNPPEGYIIDNTDCDDSDALINPEALDNTLDGVDNNCNGEIDEDVVVVSYTVEVIVTWNSESAAWPDQNAHFSWIGGATHNVNVKLWEVGSLASAGIDLLAVTGNTSDLVPEIEAAIENGTAENLINQQNWFCPDAITHPSCGDLSFEIQVSKDFPLVSLASMLGPSPDWFIGIESLSMLDDDGKFINEFVYELYPYDAGILSDNSVLFSDCCDREPLSIPQENIHLITTESGEAIGPNSLGQIIFTAIYE